MKQPQHLRILMVTPLDYNQTWNNREHHLVRCLSKMGCRVTLLYRMGSRPARGWGLLRDICTFRMRRRDEGETRWVGVDPFFNYNAGYRARADLEALISGRTLFLRDELIRLLALWAAIFRDLLFLSCFLVAAFFKVRGPYQVCIGLGPWGFLVGWILRKIGKVQLLVYEDRDFEPGLVSDRLRQRYTAWLEQFLVRRADLVISIGYRLAELRRRQLGRDVHIVPTGVDWDRFLRARNARKGGQTLLYVGNLLSWSGLDLAIRAMPQILRSCSDVQLLIVGDGFYKDYLQHLVQGLHLEERVCFLGSKPHEDLPFWMEKADIGLAHSQPVAYRIYAYPLKVLEYMAAGLPVIATDGTEAADILTRCQCGISIPYEIEAFVEAAVNLLQDRELYHQLQANGIRHSATMKWETLLAQELDLISARYAEVVGSRAEVPLNA